MSRSDDTAQSPTDAEPAPQGRVWLEDGWVDLDRREVYREGVARLSQNEAALLRYLSERGIPNAVDPRTWRQNHFEKAWLQEFRGEEALVAAVAKVSAGGAPRAKARGTYPPPGLTART